MENQQANKICKQEKALPMFEEKLGSVEIAPALEILAKIIIRQYLEDQREGTLVTKGGEPMGKTIDSE